VRLGLLLLGPASHQLPQLKHQLARTHLRLCPAHFAAVPRRLTSLSLVSVTRMVLRYLEINRPQLQHDPGVDVHRALYQLRLRVVESNHVIRSNVTAATSSIGTCLPEEAAECAAHE
jgi:hypothetical protein